MFIHMWDNIRSIVRGSRRSKKLFEGYSSPLSPNGRPYTPIQLSCRGQEKLEVVQCSEDGCAKLIQIAILDPKLRKNIRSKNTTRYCETCTAAKMKSKCVLCKAEEARHWSAELWARLPEKEQKERRHLCGKCFAEGFTNQNEKPYVCSKCKHVRGSRWYTRADVENESRCCGQRACGKTHKECLVCCRIVDLRERGKPVRKEVARYDSLRVLCEACTSQGYTEQDSRTYSCRLEGCTRTGGVELFHRTSVENYNREPTKRLQPICKKNGTATQDAQNPKKRKR